MTTRIRFHFDENVAPAIADALRRQGVDVTMTADAGLVGATDEEQLRFAREQRRVLFTLDEDFLRPDIACSQHSGIVYCHSQSLSIGQMVRDLLLLWDCLAAGDMEGKIEFL